jgi:RES domain-containing protein
VRLFRIAHPDYDAPFNGEGARLFGGRWNPKGVPLLYYASSLALSALEKRAHTPAASLGRLWRVIEIDVPDDEVGTLMHALLPENWRDQPAPDSTKTVGQEWAASLSSLCLKVPSVIIPIESNVLINPVHPKITTARHIRTDDFRFDARLAQ